jgi:CHAT domain-containing protein
MLIEAHDTRIVLSKEPVEKLVVAAPSFVPAHRPIHFSPSGYCRCVRTNAVIAIAISVAFVSCTAEDTVSPKTGPRAVQPRLTGMTEWRPCTLQALNGGRVFRDADCGITPKPPDAVSLTVGYCEDMTHTHQTAIRTMVDHPHCMDVAIGALERFATNDDRVLSDLAGAYYLRAQRNDRPTDLLLALRAADQAVAERPTADAHFNRALIEESLGFHQEARASWNAFRSDDPQWTEEADQHRQALQRAMRDPAVEWDEATKALPAALIAGDGKKVAALIRRFPSPALRYMEEKVLPAYAASPTPALRRRAETLAAAWSKRTGDPYLTDAVRAIAEASPSQLAALREGHRLVREARGASRGLEHSKAVKLYRAAQQQLVRGDSPIRFGAALGAIASALVTTHVSAHEAELARIEHEANARGYVQLEGRVHHTRANGFSLSGRPFESVDDYDDALNTSRRLNDSEVIAGIHARKALVRLYMGQKEEAWAETFLTRRYASGVVDFQGRNYIFLAMARSAAALDEPRAALRYADVGVAVLERELGRTPPEELDTINGVLRNLSIALNQRAELKMQLVDLNGVNEDLDRSNRILDEERRKAREADATRLDLRARIEQVRGQALLGSDPSGAVAAFTHALTLPYVKENGTLRAGLLARRAKAYRAIGDPDRAKSDLQQAIRELQAEEKAVLSGRRRGDGEEVWSRYFERSQEPYRLLVALLVDEKDFAQAFAVAEQSRATEPLDLIQHLDVVPDSFRRFIAGEMPGRTRVQAALPRGTFLVQFSVLEERTYVWIVSHDSFQHLELHIRASRIQRWSEELQLAARERDEVRFDAALGHPYSDLIAPVVAAIAKLPGGRDAGRRLVFIPDGAIHGLPLAALRSAKGRSLIQDVPVSIAGSSTLYIFALERDRALKPGPPSALLVGNPAFDDRLPITRGLRLLPGAEEEVKAIRAIYEPNVVVLTGADATAPAFLAGARERNIIHVAGHAMADPRVPSHSLLLLAPSKDHDGLLDAATLVKEVQLKDARLVVLSTCTSAGGAPVGPEGVAPLVRPLITAGVPGVIGSLWEVEDTAARELLAAFHRHFQSGSDAAAALRAAQLELLDHQNPRLRSGLAWAPFQVIGHASSPFASAQTNQPIRRNTP